MSASFVREVRFRTSKKFLRVSILHLLLQGFSELGTTKNISGTYFEHLINEIIRTRYILVRLDSKLYVTYNNVSHYGVVI